MPTIVIKISQFVFRVHPCMRMHKKESRCEQELTVVVNNWQKKTETEQKTKKTCHKTIGRYKISLSYKNLVSYKIKILYTNGKCTFPFPTKNNSHSWCRNIWLAKRNLRFFWRSMQRNARIVVIANQKHKNAINSKIRYKNTKTVYFCIVQPSLVCKQVLNSSNTSLLTSIIFYSNTFLLLFNKTL